MSFLTVHVTFSIQSNAEYSDGLCFPGLANGKYTACSDCALSYEAKLLGSTYGEHFIDADSFSSILSSCGAASSEYPYSTPTGSSSTSS